MTWNIIGKKILITSAMLFLGGCAFLPYHPEYQLKAAKKIENKPDRNAKIDQINIDFFEPFIKEIKKTTKAAGCHIMAVHYERLFPSLLRDF